MPLRPNTQRRCVRWSRALAATIVFASTALSAIEDHEVRIDCRALPPGEAAELETRIRTFLLVNGSARTTVLATCGANGIFIDIVRQQGTTSRAIPYASNDIGDAVIDAIDEMLAVEASPANDQADHDAAPPTPDPTSLRVASTPVPARRRTRGAVRLGVGIVRVLRPESFTRSSAQTHPVVESESPVSPASVPQNSLGVVAVVESWSNELAAGSLVRFARERRLTFGASAGAILGTGEHRGFSGIEAAVAGELGYRLPATPLWLLVGGGLSLLYVHPESAFVPSGDKYLIRPYAEFGVAVPLPGSGLGISLGGGLRIFSSRRRVDSDGLPQLELPQLVPRILVGFHDAW